MKIRFEREKLLQALQTAAAVVPTRTPKPVLENARLDCKDGECVLQATDLEVGLRCELDGVETEVPGEALLPVRLVMQTLRESREEKLQLESMGTTVLLLGSRSEFQFPTPDPLEYPEVPRFSAEAYHQVASRLFRQMIVRTAFAADPQSTRYALGGVHFELGEKTAYAVATDGRRMAIQEGPVDRVGEHKPGEGVVLPLRGVQLLERVLGDGEDPIKLAIQDGSAQVQIGSTTITLRLLEGRFPNWRNVFPKRENPVVLELNVGEFLSVTRQAAIMTDENHRSVVYTLTSGNMVLSSRGSRFGESRIELPIPYEGEELLVRLDPRYVVDFLRVLDDQGTVTWKVWGPNTAVLAATSDGYNHLIMPLDPTPAA